MIVLPELEEIKIKKIMRNIKWTKHKSIWYKSYLIRFFVNTNEFSADECPVLEALKKLVKDK